MALGTALVSQAVDYSFGVLLSDKIIDTLSSARHRYEKAEDNLRKYGNITIFVFNAFPLSSAVISLAAGMLRHRIRDAALFYFFRIVVEILVLTLIF